VAHCRGGGASMLAAMPGSTTSMAEGSSSEGGGRHYSEQTRRGRHLFCAALIFCHVGPYPTVFSIFHGPYVIFLRICEVGAPISSVPVHPRDALAAAQITGAPATGGYFELLASFQSQATTDEYATRLPL